MRKFKILLAVSVMMCSFSTAVFAGIPKTDPNSNKSVPAQNPAPIAATNATPAKTTFTYYVISLNKTTHKYTLSTDAGDANCGVGTSPCEITATSALTSPVDQSVIDDKDDGIVYVTMQPAL